MGQMFLGGQLGFMGLVPIPHPPGDTDGNGNAAGGSPSDCPSGSNGGGNSRCGGGSGGAGGGGFPTPHVGSSGGSGGTCRRGVTGNKIGCAASGKCSEGECCKPGEPICPARPRE